MIKQQVFVTRKLNPEVIAMLEKVAEVEQWTKNAPIPRELLLEKIKHVDAVLTMLTERVDEEFLASTKRLRIVANMAVGYDNIDLEACRRHEVIVTNTPDVLTESTADLAFALLMATGRRLTEANRFLLQGEWTSWSPTLMAGQNVYGSTLGIIGMGRIGEAVARRAKGFGMRILYHNRNRKPQAEQETGARYANLAELLQESDYVVLLTPLTEDTRMLMGEKQFSLMKETAVFINVSRGGTVDESALYQALVDKKIWAAGLDVFAVEPVPMDNPLLQLPNVVALPHIGSATVQTRAEMARLAAANIVEVLSGRGPLTAV
ncbi:MULTISPECIES: D-glycerate dehydrogenase [Brevibacillus]|uniref:2-hydroxyacid dehydrogenase n=1 Tax=Brevibacillus TaxID=55080 RepID=UPI000D10B4F8|nr:MULTISPECIES: D-glycerate dehydrogenase [Brevibacillus]MED1945732.1 D-glycerate dehydrogenase [Brevibacillus formosus]MED2000635.1 D-glycerate dehydrogenase [Brevibacillus formosus]MED2084519.1 D-glycerate dehydrogenase [Brevibacillus formosus]PSK15608.1 D-glycerate dehydrogenase [Brevibacillus sp. NRRL NRS-603]